MCANSSLLSRAKLPLCVSVSVCVFVCVCGRGGGEAMQHIRGESPLGLWKVQCGVMNRMLLCCLQSSEGQKGEEGDKGEEKRRTDKIAEMRGCEKWGVRWVRHGWGGGGWLEVREREER